MTVQQQQLQRSAPISVNAANSANCIWNKADLLNSRLQKVMN